MNRYWLMLLGVIALSALWHTGKSSYQLYEYYSLSARIPINKMTLTTEEYSNERFGAKAHYSFNYGARTFEGYDYLPEHIYRNREAMDQSIPRLEAQQWSVWFQPSNPLHSALQKYFPYKEIFYSLIIWGLLFYFIWIGYHPR